MDEDPRQGVRSPQRDGAQADARSAGPKGREHLRAQSLRFRQNQKARQPAGFRMGGPPDG